MRLHVPAQAREVYDVSGAGDTVIATLGVMLASGASFEQAVRYANRAAGIVVGKFGTAVVSPGRTLRGKRRLSSTRKVCKPNSTPYIRHQPVLIIPTNHVLRRNRRGRVHRIESRQSTE